MKNAYTRDRTERKEEKDNGGSEKEQRRTIKKRKGRTRGRIEGWIHGLKKKGKKRNSVPSDQDEG